MSAVLPFCSAMLGSTRPLASSSVTTEACPLTRGSSSEVVLGGGFLGGGGGGGSLSEYLYERWGGLKSRHDEKLDEKQAPAGGRATCFTVQVFCFERRRGESVVKSRHDEKMKCQSVKPT